MMMSDVFVRYAHVHGAFDDDRPASLNHPWSFGVAVMMARRQRPTSSGLRAHLGCDPYWKA